ncbi:MAG TPA: nitrate reductase molybdenum cofactor assembly chaperone [Blastocatellia bacterium]|nr:nitrate reductase molybdenum cofactor assembly chaperone [Blastocatellia bacterium]
MNHLYEIFADLLEYPGDDWGRQLESFERRMIAESEGLATRSPGFCRKIEGCSVAELQEKYTQTFDLNPVCALEIGYHLFGENYKRGLFLANLRETESPYDLGQQHQLPDYLPVLLRLLVRLDDAELRSALITECMIPAIEKMVNALEEVDSPYADLLAVIEKTLKIEAPQYSAGPHLADYNEAMPRLYSISSRAATRW